MAAGHGGQVLVAASTASLVDGIELVDLGEHGLRGLSGAYRLFQVRAEGLRSEFPSLKTLDVTPGNLPMQISSFVGRLAEVAELVAAVRTHRLVTLTGVGGVGKTRLAVHVARELVPEFDNGVWLVELASVGDPNAVPDAVAAALGVVPQHGMTVTDSIATAFAGRKMLMVLDNCEHVLDAVATLVDGLLSRCSTLRMLVTSRERLRVSGEVVYRVPTLAVPPPGENAPQAIICCESVELLVDRARAQLPTFVLGDGDAPVAATLCRRLDGIPLAIELAAARLSSMGLADVERRLDDRFRLLTAGSRSALPRQQTLLATIDWSYGLLLAQEKKLLARLSVFQGGWTLPCAEEVATRTGLDRSAFAELHGNLVDKSLVQMDPIAGALRYRLLEAVREYATAKLADEPAAVNRARVAHLAVYLGLAEEAATDLEAGSDVEVRLVALEADQENLRGALGFALADPEGVETGLRMAVALFWFWVMKGLGDEAVDSMTAALARAEPSDTSLIHLDALNGLADVLIWLGRANDALPVVERALAMAGAGDDPARTARSFLCWGQVQRWRGELPAAKEAMDRAVELAESSDRPAVVARTVGQRVAWLLNSMTSTWRFGTSRRPWKCPASLATPVASHRACLIFPSSRSIAVICVPLRHTRPTLCSCAWTSALLCF